MWPRLLSQLVELLPHATRLLPIADTYLSTRREVDRSQTAALASMSGGLREEMNGITQEFRGVSRQLDEQQTQIAALQGALEVAESHRITQIKQIEWLTGDLNSLRVWVKFGIVAILVLLLALIGLTVQLYRLR